MATNYEYEKYRNMSMSQLQNTAFGQSIRQHPFQGYDIGSFSTKELQDMILHLQLEYDRKTMDTPLEGPTKRELQKHESLKNAWEEYTVVRKLVLGK